MKKRKYNGKIVENADPVRSCWVTFRLTPAEKDKLEVLKANFAYRSTSDLMRDILFRKRIESKKVIVRLTDKTLRDRINSVTFQIRKIGANYNQVVALYHTQARQTRRDGTPWLDTARIDATLEKLMMMTEGVRDEIAVLIDVVERYTMEN